MKASRHVRQHSRRKHSTAPSYLQPPQAGNVHFHPSIQTAASLAEKDNKSVESVVQRRYGSAA